MGIYSPFECVTPQSWASGLHLKSSQFIDSFFGRLSYFAPWYQVGDLNLLFINESQIWNEEFFLPCLIIGQGFTNCCSMSKIIILPNMEYFVCSASKFYTPISNQFRVSCPEVNIFLEIFQELICLWGLEKIGAEFIKCPITLPGACSKRWTYLRRQHTGDQRLPQAASECEHGATWGAQEWRPLVSGTRALLAS